MCGGRLLSPSIETSRIEPTGAAREVTRFMTSADDDPAGTGYEPPDLGFDQDDLLKLATWKMPFGRFAGRILIELPEEYLFWFVGNGFPDGKLGFLMKLSLELKANGADGVLLDMARAMRRNRATSESD